MLSTNFLHTIFPELSLFKALSLPECLPPPKIWDALRGQKVLAHHSTISLNSIAEVYFSSSCTICFPQHKNFVFYSSADLLCVFSALPPSQFFSPQMRHIIEMSTFPTFLFTLYRKVLGRKSNKTGLPDGKFLILERNFHVFNCCLIIV